MIIIKLCHKLTVKEKNVLHLKTSVTSVPYYNYIPASVFIFNI